MPRVTPVGVNGTQVLTLAQIQQLPQQQRTQQLEDSVEVNMDVQIVAGLAPGADQIVYFSSFDEQGWVDLLNEVIAGTPASAVSAVGQLGARRGRSRLVQGRAAGDRRAPAGRRRARHHGLRRSRRRRLRRPGERRPRARRLPGLEPARARGRRHDARRPTPTSSGGSRRAIARAAAAAPPAAASAWSSRARAGRTSASPRSTRAASTDA